MLKSILVVIDGCEEAAAIQDYAVYLAKENEAYLTGVGVVDTSWIVEPFPNTFQPVYAVYGVDDLEGEHIKVGEALKSFGQLCRQNNVFAHCVEQEGRPASIIAEQAYQHDMIVMGRTPNFHFELEEADPQMTRQVARDNPRPILIVPPEAPQTYDRVLVAYDGGLQSARSLQLFLLMGLARGRSIDIVTIHKDETMAQTIAQQAKAMCRNHNTDCTIHTPQVNGSLAEVILEQADNIGAQMIVMGAFSHPTLREVLFGSNTLTIIEKGNIPLFIHH